MKVVEQFIASKTGIMSTCEDGIFINDHFVVVIDGVTDRSGKRWGGKSPGQVARDCIMETIPNIPPNTTPTEFFDRCNATVLNWYDKKAITIEMKHHINQRCSASLVVFSRYAQQIWFLGDGQILFNETRIVNDKLVDTLLAALRSYYIQTEIKRGKSEYDIYEKDTGRELILPLVSKQEQFQNQNDEGEYNFYVIDGFFSDSKGIKIVDIPKGTKFLSISSDGYPQIQSTLEASEKVLHEIISEDPLCYKKFKATKGIQKGNFSYDDRSYVKIKLA
jgi:glycerophosphoryl diester phosphodiesterase